MFCAQNDVIITWVGEPVYYSTSASMTVVFSCTGSPVIGHGCLYCNWMIIVCGLPDAGQRRYIDKFKSVGIDSVLTRFREQSGWIIQLPYKICHSSTI